MSEWTSEEDLELIKKVKEYGSKWHKIINFFPNRSINGIRHHYTVLQKSVNFDINAIQITDDDKIQGILKKKIKFSEKISQLNQFDETTILKQMIQISIDLPSISADISMFLKYVFEFQNFNKESFLKLASLNECTILLLFCKTFSVLDERELNHINYIRNDQFFFRGPVVYFNSKNDTLEIARNEKKSISDSVNINLKMENTRLLKLVKELKSIISIEKDEKELALKREESLVEVLNQLANKQQIDDKGLFVPNEVFDQYPIIGLMLKKILFKASDVNYSKFCALIQMMSTKTYRKLRDYLPLLSETSTYDFVRPFKSSLIQMIEDINAIPTLIQNLYKSNIQFNNEQKASTPIFATLGGDAASLKHSSESVALYAFQLLPLLKCIPPNVINIMKTRNGASPPEVVQQMHKIAKILNDMNILIKFISTDGDVSFDSFHRNFFEQKVQSNLQLSFDELVDLFKDELCMPISDPFHLLKAARSRLMQHLLLIDPSRFTCINTSLFSQAVNLGPVFSDRSKFGSMKDMYPLALFSWYSFTKVMSKGRFEAAYYMIPFLLLIESIRSPLLSRKDRFSFIESAFNMFVNHLKIVKNIGNDSVFKQRFTSKSIGVLFADEIFLIRIINTCIGLGVAVKYHYENLATQRIGTHDLELYFGIIRCLSFFDNSYSNALRVAVEAIIVKQLSLELGTSITISKRENEAGIVLTNEINNQHDINMDWSLIIDVTYNLMKGDNVEERKLHMIESMLDSYTQLITKSHEYKTPKVPNLCRGTLPIHRYNIINYSMSTLPLPCTDSTFQFYLSDSQFSKKIQKASIFQWCTRLCASIIGLKYKCKSKVKIPFDYDLNNEDDIEKIVDFLTHPLEITPENKEIADLVLKENEKNENTFDFYPLTFLEKEQTNSKMIDIQAQEILNNLKDKRKFQEAVKSSGNPKKLIKQALKKSFVLSLKKAMKIFLNIVNQMNRDEFIFKFKTNFSEGLISPFKTYINDEEIPDKYQESIINYVLDSNDNL